MSESPQFIRCANGEQLAYHHIDGNSPGVTFLGGFKADMSGTKATTLSTYCVERDIQFTRFDYSGHGRSGGQFTEGSIGRWLKDSLTIIEEITEGPQVLVGSSMGAWISLLSAIQRPEKAAAILGIASAADFTENLIWENLDHARREALTTYGQIEQPSSYQSDPYPITMHLITEAREHLLLQDRISICCPVRLIHGQNDVDVPWQTTIRIAENLESDDVHTYLIKDAEHRLSRDIDIQFILDRLGELLEHLGVKHA